MGAFIRGEVVVLPFPFSDLSNVTKRRPALVVAKLAGNDLILCQITSQQSSYDKYAIRLVNSDFATGKLDKDSYIRPNRLFTADSSIISYSVGELKIDKLNAVTEKLIEIIKGNL